MNFDVLIRPRRSRAVRVQRWVRGDAVARLMALLGGALLLSLFGFPFGLGVAQESVEVGRDAFSQRKYPWYDSENDAIKRVEMNDRLGAKSVGRNEIPLASPVTPKARKKRNSTSGQGLGFAAWLMIGLVAAGVVGILIWAFLRLESNQELSTTRVPKRSMEESIRELPFPLESATGDFRQRAQQAMAAGDFRTAMIYLFSHVLVSLDQQGLIRLQKGKTNRQYLNELRTNRPLATYYQCVMVPFESVFFGDHELQSSEFSQCWDQLDQFQAGLQQANQVSHA